MSELVQTGLLQNDGVSAGALLRQARMAKGLHIAAVATAIKVAPQKLELLEGDRIAELPGDAFARALAQTVCRYLQIDAAPIMAVLPAAPVHSLDRMGRGLNQPFHDGPAPRDTPAAQLLKNPVLLSALALVVAAVLVYALPKEWFSERLQRTMRSAPESGVVVQSLPLPGAQTADDVGTVMGVGSTASAALAAPMAEPSAPPAPPASPPPRQRP
jgi:cytoskeleton protein RodZ